MSSYISSFLIEPVVRQARLFSRSAFESEASDGPHDDRGAAGENGTPIAAREEQDVRTGFEDGNQETIQDVEMTSALEATAVNGGQTVQEDASTDGPATAIATAPHEPSEDSEAGRDRARTDPVPQPSNSEEDSPLRMIQDRFRAMNISFPGAVNEAGLRMTDDPRQRRTLWQNRLASGGITPRLGDGALPEDDGNGPMRKRILAIQGMNVTTSEKSRLMHKLMMEQYRSSPLTPSTAQPPSQDRPGTPNSAQSANDTLHDTSPSTSMSTAPDVEYYVPPNDLRPTYWIRKKRVQDGAPEGTAPALGKGLADDDDEPRAFGCVHYKRNVKLQCSACYRWYTCRFCHDGVEDHILDRRATRHMLCMLCKTAQPASRTCRHCGEDAAWYYCDLCKLWDDDPEKSIYHCVDCGICRVGQGLGKDFYHCKTCCVCLSISIADSHRCIERSTDCNCPICGEYMFTSPQTVVFMRCGHSIHKICYKEHAQNSYKCPICSRSIMNMEMTFRHLDHAIEAQPMPEHFRDTKALVYCNDCCAKTSVSYHWLGLKCAICDSYNTAQLQLLSDSHDSPPLGNRSPTPAAPTVSSNEVDMVLSEAAQSPPLLSQPQTPAPISPRGRPRTSSATRPRRPSSASALDALRLSPTDTLHRRGARSTSTTALHLSASASGSGDGDDEMDTDAEASEDDDDDDDDDEELDFWGGESPRKKVKFSPPSPGGGGAGGSASRWPPPTPEEEDVGAKTAGGGTADRDESGSDSGAGDERMDDDDDDDEDDDDDGNNGTAERDEAWEIFGHR